MEGFRILEITQPSKVFMRITNNRKGAEKHLNRIKKISQIPVQYEYYA